MDHWTASMRRPIATAALVLTVAWGCGTSSNGGEAGDSSVGITETTSDTMTTTSISATSTTSPAAGTTEIVSTPPSSAGSISPSTTSSTTTTTTTTTLVDDVGIAWATVDVVDATRATDEVLGPEGVVLLTASPTRTIPTVLLYPGRDGGGEGAPAARVEPRPLVVWLNGLGGSAAAGDPLLLALYEAGYVVAAPNVREIAAPVSHGGGYVHQPGDVSAVIDALTTPDDGVVDDLAAIVDPARIGVAGHSIGGSGVYGVAFHDCCRDDRISAAAVFAPPRIDFEGGEFRFSGLPLLIVHGSADQIIALDQSESVRDEAEDALLVVQAEADHFQPVYGYERPDALALSEGLLTTFLDVHVAGVTEIDALDKLIAEYGERIMVQ